MYIVYLLEFENSDKVFVGLSDDLNKQLKLEMEFFKIEYSFDISEIKMLSILLTEEDALIEKEKLLQTTESNNINSLHTENISQAYNVSSVDIWRDNKSIYNLHTEEENHFIDKAIEEDFNELGYNRFGFDRNGLDKFGYDENGYDSTGLDEDGYDSDGFDIYLLDKEGFDKDGYDKNGNKKVVIKKKKVIDFNDPSLALIINNKNNGYAKENHMSDQNKIRQNSNKDVSSSSMDGSIEYDKNGYNEMGYNKYGLHKEGYDANGCDIYGKKWKPSK